MIKIAAHIPNPHDATNWYRGTGPLSNLRRQFDEIEVSMIREWSFSSVQMHDVAFFQRPSTASELEAIRICKRLNVPVIVDYDDLLFDIPTDNPAYGAYMNKATQENIINIMREADVIWVSTKELKRCIQIPQGSLNEKVYVIPNALDDHALVSGKRTMPPMVRHPSIVWRGSPTHQRDLVEYVPEILDVAELHPKNSFVFVGYNPWFLTDRMKQRQAIIAGAMPVGEFMDFLYGTAAQVGMVPLHDSRFNRCKSNIAWLEMTWSGSVVLAPDWEEWQHPGVIKYSDTESFQRGLTELLTSSPAKLSELNALSWKHIQEHFLLSKVNHLRYHTIMAALGKTEWIDGWQRLPDEDEEVMELG